MYVYRIEDLEPNEANKVLFGNVVKSDGFCIDFVFYRRAYSEDDDSESIRRHILTISDFSINEVAESYRPSFLDPGRKSVFTATTGLDTKEHEIRRCSTQEYYHFTGSTAYSKRLQQMKDTAGITAIESATPTAKTARNITYCRFLDHILANMDRLFTFYGFDTAKDRFNLYQGKQRAPEMMVNLLLDGGSKYNRKKRFKKKDGKRKEQIKKEKRKSKRKKRMRKNEKKKGKNRQQQYKR